ncbi:MAG: cobalt-precorrin-5B (C(1))-methyltransferase [Pseudomonadota bacterium]|nr:cobalt-precorrin-5B (C(1))-methyltransferase [Pseudomonadota bacterium]
MARKPTEKLRHGWTTGACATAAAKAAYTALLTGCFPDPVEIILPKGKTPSFALAREKIDGKKASAAIVKDAGDDPDVTHGALIQVEIDPRDDDGHGVTFRAGEGVGTVTREGLPLAIGEPAINPAPRQMIEKVITEVADTYGGNGNVIVTISVEGGAALALKTWNPRLGIQGGISILGTTGVVVPYSCAAWIESIHRGIDVARAAGETTIAGCTGKTSEDRCQALLNLPDHAMIDMGDFVGGMLKYLRKHPVPNIVISGGFAKVCKLAQGNLDLHSGRSQVDLPWLAKVAEELGADNATQSAIRRANTAAAALFIAEKVELPLADDVAQRASGVAQDTVGDTGSNFRVLIFDRGGNLAGSSNA